MNNLAITPEQALIKLSEQDTPEAKAILNYVGMIKTKNIAVLGDNEVFTIRDKNGEVKAFKRSITLSIQNGGLLKMPAAGNPIIVTAQGYEIWAEGVGASVVFPPEVLVGNEWKSNPHAERDPKNRRILAVHSRAVAYRYTSIGVKQAIDWTTIFDTPSYRMIDLLAKAKQYPQAFKVLPVEMKPEVLKNETWAHYPFDESMNLWMDTSHTEVIKWLGQIMNREKKSMDFAQTFSRRNSLKHLSGIQKAPFDNWLIPVIAWRETGDRKAWGLSEYNDMQDNVVEMVSNKNSKSSSCEVKTGVEKMSEEENIEDLEANIDPEDNPDKSNNQTSQTQKEQPKNEPAELSKEVKQVLYLVDNFPSEFEKACKLLNIDHLAPVVELSTEAAVKIFKKINELLDQD